MTHEWGMFIIGVFTGLITGGGAVFVFGLFEKDRVEDEWEKRWWEDHHPGHSWNHDVRHKP